MKSIHAILLSLVIFFLWWGYLSGRVYNFRGIGVAGTINQPADRYSGFFEMSNWGKEWTGSSRVVTGWMVTVPYFLLGKPFFAMVRPQLLESGYPLMLISSVTNSSALLYAFIVLGMAFPSFYGFTALVAFGLVPLVTMTQGLSQSDTLALFYWALLLSFLVRSAAESSDRRDLIFVVGAGVLGAWTKENEAVAFGIGLFLLALTSRYHRIQRPWWRMWLAETIGAVTALGISYVLIHRHPDWYWAIPGEKHMDAMWRHYAFQITFGTVWFYLGSMGKGPLVIAILCLTGSLLAGKKSSPARQEWARLVVWCATMCLVGELLTVAVGRYVVAMVYEWSRQLLVFCYLFTWWLFGMILLLTPALIRENSGSKR